MAQHTLSTAQIDSLKQRMNRFAERNPDIRIQRKLSDSDTDYYRRLFMFFVALKLSYLHDDELFDHLKIVDSHETGKGEEFLDAYMLLDHGDDLLLHLFQFKYTENFGKGVSTKELRSFVSRMNEEFQHGDLSEQSPIEAFQQVKDDLSEALSVGRKKLRIHCHYVVNGQGVDEKDRPKVDDLREQHSSDQQKHGFQFDVYGGLDIYNLVEHGRIPIHEERVEFEFPDKDSVLHQQFGTNREGMPGHVMVGFMNVNQLIRLLARYSANELFERNVRLFLGARGTVNRGIIESVTTSRNRWFGFMNNGVSITADKVEVLGPPNKRKLSVRLSNMQIINGCQTVNSLYQAKHDVATRDHFNANTNVMVRVYEVSPENKEFMEALILATNSQNAIRAEDLVANDVSLRVLQDTFHQYGIGFERKEGEQFVKNGFLEVFTKEDVATAFLAVTTDNAPKLWGTLGRAKLFRRETEFRLVFPEDLVLDENKTNLHALKLLMSHSILTNCRERLIKGKPQETAPDIRKARYYVARLIYRACECEIVQKLNSASQEKPSKRVAESLLKFFASIVETQFDKASRLFISRLQSFQETNKLVLDAALKNEQFASAVFNNQNAIEVVPRQIKKKAAKKPSEAKR